MTTGKTIALTRRTFVGKVMSLLLNMRARLVITVLLRSKLLLISCLQSPSAVILETRKVKSATVSTVSSSICMKWWDGMPWSSFSECWALSQLFHSPLSLSSPLDLYNWLEYFMASICCFENETCLKTLQCVGFCSLSALCSLWDPSSLTSDQTWACSSGNVES